MKRKLAIATLLVSVALALSLWIYRRNISARIIEYSVSELLARQGVTNVEKGEYAASFSGATLSFIKGTIGSTKFEAQDIEASFPDIFRGELESITAKNVGLNLICSESTSTGRNFQFPNLPLKTIQISNLHVTYKLCNGVTVDALGLVSIKNGSNSSEKGVSIELVSNNIELKLNPSIIPKVSVSISAEANKDGYFVDVKSMETKIFDGKVIVLPFSIKNGVLPKSIKISLRQIDLSKLMELYDVSTSIKVTGRINADAPISLTKTQKVTVSGGTLTGASGEIKWPYTAAEGDSPLNTYARRALEDFGYSEMTGNFSLLESGDLTVKLNLKGTAPNIHKTRPLHLNLTIEENLPKLLRSLKLLNRFPSELAEKHGG